MLEYKYFIRRIYEVSPGVLAFEVGDYRGQAVFNFKPGQYAMISYKNSQGQIEDKHAFSIASSPTQRNFLRFGIKIGGPFTQGLAKLKEGGELLVSGPYGKFIFDEKKYLDLVLIAGGIGITPFFSVINYATDKKLPNKLSLIYCARTSQGASFYEDLKSVSNINPNFKALYLFNEETAVSSLANVINARLDAGILENFIKSIKGKTFFLCGPPLFMKSAINNLLSLGVAKNQIELEEFSMIPDKTLWVRLRNLGYAFSVALILLVITFSSINKSSLASSQKKYNANKLNQLNQLVYNRMLAIYNSKNQALASLNQQILAATITSGASSVAQNKSPNTILTPVPVLAVNPTPLSTISPPPAPVYIPTPAPIFIPAPRTRVS